MARDGDDLLPDLDLAEIMRQRPLGLGSIGHVMRLVAAVTVSWAVAVAISHSTLGIFAPITTLFVVQASAWTTLGMSIQRILGTGIGVLVASAWVNLAGLTWWSFALGVGASLLIARLLPWSLGGQLQIPVAVVFVLALGPGAISQDLWRVLDVLIGGVVGLLAVFVYPPRPKLTALDNALRTYRDAIIDTLASVGRESGARDMPLADGELHDFVVPSRRLRDLADDSRAELVRLVEGVQFNLRARGLRDVVHVRAGQVRRLSGIGVQVRGIVGAANRTYDRAEVVPRLDGEELGRLIDKVVALMHGVLGAPEEQLGRRDPALAERLDASLEAELKRAAEIVIDHKAGVGGALASVSMIGRLDLVRIQLGEFRDGED